LKFEIHAGGKMKKPENEHRRAERHTKIINVECEVGRFPDDITGDKAKLKEGQSFRATTINVSETGMLVNCDFLFPERTTLKVVFPAGEILENQAKVKVEIAWTKRNAYKLFGRYSAGLHIVEAKKTDIEKLVQYFK
jgi:hypothetical protein